MVGFQALWGGDWEVVLGVQHGHPLTPYSVAGCLPICQSSEPLETVSS